MGCTVIGNAIICGPNRAITDAPAAREWSDVWGLDYPSDRSGEHDHKCVGCGHVTRCTCRHPDLALQSCPWCPKNADVLGGGVTR